MPAAFSKKLKKPKARSLLPDFYGKAIKQLAERSQLPSFFNQAILKEKARTEQPDFFTKGIFHTKRAEQNDHFSAPRKARDKDAQADHFAGEVNDRQHRDEDLYSKGSTRKIWRKNFIGERFRLFNRDPNKRKQKNPSKKDNDPFGRDPREKEAPQNPRGEMDLFQGGVMPKMKDLR